MFLPFPRERLTGHQYRGGCRQGPAAQGEMLRPRDADTAALSSESPVSCSLCLPAELAGFCGSCFEAATPPHSLSSCGVFGDSEVRVTVRGGTAPCPALGVCSSSAGRDRFKAPRHQSCCYCKAALSGGLFDKGNY